MEKIILDQPHTHEGVLHKAGAELQVLLHDAEWLVRQGIARFVPGVVKRSSTPPAPPAEPVAPPPTAG